MMDNLLNNVDDSWSNWNLSSTEGCWGFQTSEQDKVCEKMEQKAKVQLALTKRLGHI